MVFTKFTFVAVYGQYFNKFAGRSKRVLEALLLHTYNKSTSCLEHQTLKVSEVF